MDITILLWFQTIRELLGPGVDLAVSYMSDFFAAAGIPLILIIFWCTDRRKGRYFLTVLALSLFLNQFLKVSFAVYRPWIRCPELVPAEAALRTATGYSFPSAHTQLACSTYGGMFFKADRSHGVRRFLLAAAAVFTGLSRMYLGVHTPQDVIVAALISVLCIFTADKFVSRMSIEENRKKAIFWILIISAVSVLYTIFKDYPVNFIDGELIVSPAGMKKDSLRQIGLFAGILCVLYSGPAEIAFPGSRPVNIRKTAVSFLLLAASYLFVNVSLSLVIKEEYAALAAALTVGFLAAYFIPLRIFDRRRS